MVFTANNSSPGAGLSFDRLNRLSAAIRRDVANDQYDGAAICVARHGVVGLIEAIGFADRAAGRTLCVDDVFNLLSVSKAFTDVIVLSLIELDEGDLETARLEDRRQRG